MLGYNILIDK